jgi:hypothetical protein
MRQKAIIYFALGRIFVAVAGLHAPKRRLKQFYIQIRRHGVQTLVVSMILLGNVVIKKVNSIY